MANPDAVVAAAEVAAVEEGETKEEIGEGGPHLEDQTDLDREKDSVRAIDPDLRRLLAAELDPGQRRLRRHDTSASSAKTRMRAV